ncbi:glutaminase [Plakobranchus ocellatus]|uniref:glutaminase n=1 Tax=Plakobranchus ocellatus TaxID=259542 RepID=A0AAV4DLB6_9GAST|nr:glutaminase [Plakobranchus ocellatus]
MSKPLTYAMVLDELGPDVVHQYVGQEPSGQAFNTISLDQQNRPHNPMVNSGAVVMCALLKQGMNIADKFDYNQQKLKQLSGNEYISFNNSVFLSERQTADRNYAIGYYMKENQQFQIIQMQFVTHWAGIPWTAKKTNERVLNEANKRRSLVRTIRKRQATFLGHVMRRGKLEHLVTTGKFEGKRSRGRQREKIMDGLATWRGPGKVSDILAAVKDRDLWRDMIANAYKQGNLMMMMGWDGL